MWEIKFIAIREGIYPHVRFRPVVVWHYFPVEGRC